MDSLASPNEPRFEILNGETVMITPSPAVGHNRVISHLSFVFGNYQKGKKCILFVDGTDVYLTEDDQVIPDFKLYVIRISLSMTAFMEHPI